MRFESRTGPFFLARWRAGVFKGRGQGMRGHDRISCCANEASRGEKGTGERPRERNVFPRRFAKQCP